MSTSNLATAVHALQGEIGTLQRDAINPHFRSRYISLETLVEAVQPLLTKHGLIWVCRPEHNDNVPSLNYELTEINSGQSIAGEMPLLLEKNNAQGFGSALTYARRYALCAVLNIVADVDDDGEKATKQAAKKSEPAEDFASKVRKTGIKGNEVKMWLLTEGGFDQAGIDSQPTLRDLLNNLDEGTQKPLLAWANGS